MAWCDESAGRLRDALRPLGDPGRAAAMTAYLKGAAPCLGVSATTRRRVQREVWRNLPPPDHEELWLAVADLTEAPQREYQYAAVELLGRYRAALEPGDFAGRIESLLLLRPWWDTVDAMGSLVVTPMVVASPELLVEVWRWNGSPDQWLVRASIQHQRGLRDSTDVPRLLAMCEPHASDRRFFVVKAIGWALRDAAAIDAGAVRGFLAEHPELPAVARREAQRGLDRLPAAASGGEPHRPA